MVRNTKGSIYIPPATPLALQLVEPLQGITRSHPPPPLWILKPNTRKTVSIWHGQPSVSLRFTNSIFSFFFYLFVFFLTVKKPQNEKKCLN